MTSWSARLSWLTSRIFHLSALSSENTIKHADSIWCGSTAASNNWGTGINPLLDKLNVHSILFNSVIPFDSGNVVLRWEPGTNVTIRWDSHTFRDNLFEVLDMGKNWESIEAIDADEGSIFEVMNDVCKWCPTSNNSNRFSWHAEWNAPTPRCKFTRNFCLPDCFLTICLGFNDDKVDSSFK